MISGRDSAMVRAWIARGPFTSPNGMLSVRAVKAYYDGALGSRGAQLLADYSDRPGHRGVSGGAYGFDQRLIADAMTAGFQVGVHAIGDAGNRATLDFIDSVMRAAPSARDHRHRVEHAQVVSPPDIARYASMGVIASVQPPHAVEDKGWLKSASAASASRVRMRGARCDAGTRGWRFLATCRVRAGVRFTGAFGHDPSRHDGCSKRWLVSGAAHDGRGSRARIFGVGTRMRALMNSTLERLLWGSVRILR